MHKQVLEIKNNKIRTRRSTDSGGATPGHTSSNDLAGRSTTLANDLAGGSPCYSFSSVTV